MLRESDGLDDLEKEFLQYYPSKSGDTFSVLRGENPAQGRAKGYPEIVVVVAALV